MNSTDRDETLPQLVYVVIDLKITRKKRDLKILEVQDITDSAYSGFDRIHKTSLWDLICSDVVEKAKRYGCHVCFEKQLNPHPHRKLRKLHFR